MHSVPDDVSYLQQNGSVAVNPFGADTGVSKTGDVVYLYLLHYMGDFVGLAVILLQVVWRCQVWSCLLFSRCVLFGSTYLCAHAHAARLEAYLHNLFSKNMRAWFLVD